MTYKENITAILECHFSGFKQEIIDSACNCILELEPCEYAPFTIEELKDEDTQKLLRGFKNQQVIVTDNDCSPSVKIIEPCDVPDINVGDMISRQAVLSKIKEVCFSEEWIQFRVDKGSNGQRDFLIDYIEQLPPVTPKAKTDVLDKIKAEIIEKSIIDCELHGCGTSDLLIDTSEALDIIDKYKAESR